MEEEYIGAIDQGTTGTRFILFDKNGEIAEKSYIRHDQYYPKSGWVEHDPMEIWNNTRRVLKEVLSNVDSAKVASIGLANQRETTVVWDPENGKPLGNAIVWQDTRTKEFCESVEGSDFDDLLRNRTGLRPHTYFSGTKLRWILNNRSGVERKLKDNRAIFGNIDSWLIWNLTGGSDEGVHITDYTNASRTLLMNLKSMKWDEDILEELEIPRKMLPEIRPSSDSDFYGRTKISSIDNEIPICGDLGDQQAALFGQTCFDSGDAKSTYGTGNFTLMNTGSDLLNSEDGLLTTVAYGLKENSCNYALEGSVPVAGAAVNWLKDSLGLIDRSSETEELADEVEDTEGVYFVPAFSGLFAPYWDMSARGTVVGLSGSTRKSHLVRAVLESICYQARDILSIMERGFEIQLDELKVDGGMTQNDLLMQLQADLLGKRIVRPKVKETTALGAAYAAGLAVGFWEDLDSLRKNWKTDREFRPKMNEEVREKKYTRWKRAVKKARGWLS